MRDGSGHEIEIKLAVRDVASLERRLRKLHAVRGARIHEVNAVFDTPEQTLRRRGQLLRLRVERREGLRATASRNRGASSGRGRRQALVTSALFPRAVAQEAIVTVKTRPGHAMPVRKGPDTQRKGSRGSYKVRREIEFVVPDATALRAALACLGFRPAFYYEKYRTTYRLPALRGMTLDLDETPVGTFIELEGPPGAIDRARRLLGYQARETILASYGALYAASQRARGRPFRHMLFES